MQYNLCGGDALESTPYIKLDELIVRLSSKFPSIVVDRKKGDAYVEERIDRLTKLNAPDVVIDSERSFRGKVTFVQIAAAHWVNATVTSYLTDVSLSLGDSVRLEVEDAKDQAAEQAIAREVALALGLSLYQPTCD